MKKGFTLIELLIVVAIIAILAAIAVPNFLEAQIRAKVSRAKNDLRTIATAVESYYVDYNGPPIGYYELSRWDPRNMGLPTALKNEWIFSRMTSPVAYISTPPMDPFIEMGMFDGGGNLVTGDGFRLYHYQSVDTKTRLGRAHPSGGVYVEAAGRGVKWTCNSVGPSKRWKPEDWSGSRHVVGAPALLLTYPSHLMYPDLVYDSTNGTKSFGYMITSNKGMM